MGIGGSAAEPGIRLGIDHPFYITCALFSEPMHDVPYSVVLPPVTTMHEQRGVNHPTWHCGDSGRRKVVQTVDNDVIERWVIERKVIGG